MNRVKKYRTYGSYIICTILGVVFLLAAFSKIGDLRSFQGTVQHIDFLPAWMQGVTVLFIPGLELVVGMCLVLRVCSRETLFIALAVLLSFTVFAIHSTLTTHANHCGCFKLQVPVWLQLSGWGVVARNCTLLTLTAVGFYLSEPELTKQRV